MTEAAQDWTPGNQTPRSLPKTKGRFQIQNLNSYFVISYKLQIYML